MASKLLVALRDQGILKINTFCLRSQIAVRCLAQLNNSGESNQDAAKISVNQTETDAPSLNTDNSDYKAKDYYSYDVNSYFDYEVEMQKYRLTQPNPADM